jgi:MFS family permease
VLAATLLLHQCFGLINEDIGPDPNYVWVALVYSLTLAIGLTFVGRLSDIFGRRWFFIGGALIALVGAVVCASAKSIPMLIGGETLIGLGASSQLSFPFAMGELVPVKHRFLGNAILYLSCFPFSGFGPAVANAVVLHTGPGWRMGYWLLVIIDFLSLACYVVFYRPPTFHMKHKNDNIMNWIKHLDYIGALLFTCGILFVLDGLVMGTFSVSLEVCTRHWLHGRWLHHMYYVRHVGMLCTIDRTSHANEALPKLEMGRLLGLAWLRRWSILCTCHCLAVDGLDIIR